jgi:hypothetical protein
MGGFLAGLGSAIGGAGQAAAHYGDQIRGILESRRKDFTRVLSEAVQHDQDPESYAKGVSIISDLASNKPMHKIVPAFQQWITKKHEGDVALAQAFGHAPSEPSAGGSAMKAPPGPANPVGPSAALPSTSPLTGGPGLGSEQAAPAQAPQDVPRGTSPIPPIAATPAAAPPPIVPPQPVPKVARSPYERYNQAVERGQRIPPALQVAATPELTARAQASAKLQETKDLDNYLLEELGPKRLAVLKASVKDWDKLPPFVQAQYTAATMGVSPPGAMGMAGAIYNPIMKPEDAATLERQFPGILKQFNIDPKTTPMVTTLRSKLDPTGPPEHVIGVNPGFTQVISPAGGPEIVPKVPGIPQTSGGPATTASQVAPHLVTDAQGNRRFISAAQAGGGVAGIDTSLLPTQSNEIRSIQTVDANGNPVTRLEPVTTSHQKVLPKGSAPKVPGVPGAPAPAPRSSGAKEFEKPLTALQQLTEEQKLNQYNIAIGRVQSLQQRLPLLNNLIDAGRIELHLDSSGFIKALLNRAMPMSKEEEQLAGDFRTLMEDINLLRGPMGATGFRGPEAFAALQAQRGQLMARPGITSAVLANTLKALQGQSEPIARKLRKPVGEAAPAGTRKVWDEKLNKFVDQ